MVDQTVADDEQLHVGESADFPRRATPAPSMRSRGYYQLIQGGEGAFRFTLRAGNHETILESGVYWSRQSALNTVDTLRRLGERESQYLVRTDVDGRFRFDVLDDLGNSMATSMPYATRSGLMAGMASVRRHCVAPSFRGLVFRTSVLG